MPNAVIPQWLRIGDNVDALNALVDQTSSDLGVVPFVGAGLSIPYGFPGWTDFLLQEATPALRGRVGASIEAGDYEGAAEIIAEALGDEHFRARVRDVFGLRRSAATDARGAVRWLPSLASGPVVTTNFDRVLEECFERAGLPFLQELWGATHRDAFVSALHRNRRVLLKLHGDAEDRAQQILTSADYDRHYRVGASDTPADGLLPPAIRLLIQTRPLLFLGCSLQTDRLLRVLHALDMPVTHFALLEEPASELSREYQRLGAHHIRPIWYPRGQHEAIDAILEWLCAQRPSGRAVQSVTTARHAYKFLISYDSADEADFFGRTREIAAVKHLVSEHAFTVLFGASGSGKTSLVRAGVMPALWRDQSVCVYTRCSQDPVFELKEAVRRAVTPSVPGLHERLGGSLVKLIEFAAKALGRRLVVIIDQFETFFALPVHSQKPLLKELAEWRRSDTSFHLAIVIRSEQLASLDVFKACIDSPLRYVFGLTGLDRVGAQEAITKPALRKGIRYRPEALQTLIDGLCEQSGSGADVLPAYLQIVCTRLVDARTGPDDVTLDDIEASGGVPGIIKGYVDYALSSLDDAHRAHAWRVLKRATTADGGKTAIRKAGLCQDPDDERLVDLLCERRLMRVTDEGSYELAHDRLADTIRSAMSEAEKASVKLAGMLRLAYVLSHEHHIEPTVDFSEVIRRHTHDDTFWVEPTILEWAKRRASRFRRSRVRQVAAFGFALVVSGLAIVAAYQYYPRLTTRIAIDRKTIDAGAFDMGRSESGQSSPRHSVAVPQFALATREVTNAEYLAYLHAFREVVPDSVPNLRRVGFEQHPVVGLTWHDARRFCEWTGGRLPTEAEWEKAATWDPAAQRKRNWPWGQSWDESRIHSLDSKGAGTVSGDSLSAGASAYGVLHLAGNAAEWTNSVFRPYPYVASDGREDVDQPGPRVVRGLSYADLPGAADPTNRAAVDSRTADPRVGFRCAWSDK